MSVNLKRLSEITPALSPSMTDQLVGVQGGNDVLFNVGDIGGRELATGNLSFYVSTTGSDSNPGTIASPFATIQHAVNIATAFDYQNLYFPTINIEAGTYSVSPGVRLPSLVNAIGSGILQGAGHTLTTITNDPFFGLLQKNSIFLATGAAANWNPKDLATDGNTFHYCALNGSIITIDSTTLDFNSSHPTHPGDASPFCTDSGGTIAVQSSTLNLNAAATTGILDFYQGFRFAQFSIFSSTINWPVGAFVNSNLIDTQFNDVGTGTISWLSVTNTNAGTLSVGVKLFISQSGGDMFVTTNNGLPSDLPGTSVFGDASLDNTCYLLSSNLSFEGIGMQNFTFPPRVLLNTWYFGKDNNAPTGAGIRTLINDNGTIVTVASGAPYQVTTPTTGDTVASTYGLRSSIVNPAGTLGSLTVNLPTGVIDGDITRIAFTKAITSLTIASTVGATIVGAPTSAAAGSAFQFLYSSTSTSTTATPIWYIN